MYQSLVKEYKTSPDIKHPKRTPMSKTEPKTATNSSLLQQSLGNQLTGKLLQRKCLKCEETELIGVQAKLKIGAAHDQYEQEADRTADQVMRMNNRDVTRKVEQGKIQRMPIQQLAVQLKNISSNSENKLQRNNESVVAENNLNGAIMDSGVTRTLSSRGQRLKPSLRNFMEPRFGYDFSQVRVHTGSEPSKLSRSIGAKAFTVGNNIFFNDSYFKPDSYDGKHLLAHELTHTLQQTGREKRIQRKPTDWGKFKIPTYKILNVKGNNVGADMKLEFHPDKKKVNAKKIGLVQTLDQKIGKWNEPLNPTKANHTVKSGPGKGRTIDKRSLYTNPLYAADTAKSTDKLGDTPTASSWGQHGWHYFDAAKNEKTQAAVLIDRPQMGAYKEEKSQTFETAALAVEGVQAGKWMGSVEWGWKMNSKGVVTLKPFKVVSRGSPSKGFMGAAKQWNKSKVRGTIKAARKPTNVYRWTNSGFVVAYTIPQGTTVTLAMEDGIAYGGTMYNIVTIKRGKTSVKGVMETSDLKDQGDGKDTIDLPLSAP